MYTATIILLLGFEESNKMETGSAKAMPITTDPLCYRLSHPCRNMWQTVDCCDLTDGCNISKEMHGA